MKQRVCSILHNIFFLCGLHNVFIQAVLEILCWKAYRSNCLVILFTTFPWLFKSTNVFFCFVDWKTVQGPIKAAELYRQSVIQDHASEKPLYMHLDLTSSISDQEASLIAFYKACNAKWACPLKTRLEGGFLNLCIFFANNSWSN